MTRESFYQTKQFLNDFLREPLPHRMPRLQKTIAAGILAEKLEQRKSIRTLYHVALSSLHLPTKNLPKLLPTTLASSELSAVINLSDTNWYLRRQEHPALPSKLLSTLPLGGVHSGFHLFLDLWPWIIPPWIIMILSVCPPWLIPPVPNKTVLLLSFAFLQQQPWIVPLLALLLLR